VWKSKPAGPFGLRIDRLLLAMRWSARKAAPHFGCLYQKIENIHYGRQRADVAFVEQLAALEKRYAKQLEVYSLQKGMQRTHGTLRQETRARVNELLNQIEDEKIAHARPEDLQTVGLVGTAPAAPPPCRVVRSAREILSPPLPGRIPTRRPERRAMETRRSSFGRRRPARADAGVPAAEGLNA
jgi:hypothetical protein